MKRLLIRFRLFLLELQQQEARLQYARLQSETLKLQQSEPFARKRIADLQHKEIHMRRSLNRHTTRHYLYQFSTRTPNSTEKT